MENEEIKKEKERIMQEKFDKLSENYLLQGVLARKIQQFVKDNKNNAVLMDYLKMMKNLENCQTSIKVQKDDLYHEMEENKKKTITNDFIEVNCKFAYKRTTFDEKKYFEDHKITDEERKKYLKESITKGNVTIKEKRTDYKV